MLTSSCALSRLDIDVALAEIVHFLQSDERLPTRTRKAVQFLNVSAVTQKHCVESAIAKCACGEADEAYSASHAASADILRRVSHAYRRGSASRWCTNTLIRHTQSCSTALCARAQGRRLRQHRFQRTRSDKCAKGLASPSMCVKHGRMPHPYDTGTQDCEYCRRVVCT